MSALKQPATPLPWRIAAVEPGRNPFYPIVGSAFQYVAHVEIHARGGSNRDADYLTHAANAYPKLVEALHGLQGLVQLTAHAHDIGVIKNHRYVEAEALLRELGEAS